MSEGLPLAARYLCDKPMLRLTQHNIAIMECAQQVLKEEAAEAPTKDSKLARGLLSNALASDAQNLFQRCSNMAPRSNLLRISMHRPAKFNQTWTRPNVT